MPRALLEHQMGDLSVDAYMNMLETYRRDGEPCEYSLVEYWDVRAGRVYHMIQGCDWALSDAPMPYGLPFQTLGYNPGLAREAWISDVELIAPTQRDVNELVSGRREVVTTMQPRVVVEEGVFKDTAAADRWAQSKTNQVTFVEPSPDGRPLRDKFFVSPAPPLTMDFQRHLEDQRQSGRYVAGVADYQRGQVSNVRTAEEMTTLKAASDDRASNRVNALDAFFGRVYRTALDIFRWAILNPDDSGIDLLALYDELGIEDVDESTWAQEILDTSPRWTFDAYSPLKENLYSRRASLERLLPLLAGTPLGEEFDMHELAREIQETFKLRPSVVPVKLPPPAPPSMAPAALPPEGVTPGAPIPGAPVPGVEGVLPGAGGPVVA